MRSLMSAVGRTFLKASIAVFIVYIYGVLDAPNLHEQGALAVAASVAAVIAGLRAIEAYAPQLTLSTLLHLTGVLASVVDAFARAFVGALIAALIGVLAAPDLHTARAVAVAGIVGAVTAGVQAIEALFTRGVTPLVQLGLPEPKKP